jgi:hypothetical protein
MIPGRNGTCQKDISAVCSLASPCHTGLHDVSPTISEVKAGVQRETIDNGGNPMCSGLIHYTTELLPSISGECSELDTNLLTN